MKKSIPMQLRSVLAAHLSLGLDLGSEESVFCVLDCAGEVILRARFGMSPTELTPAVAGLDGCVVMLESCNQSSWVARALRSLGHYVIVANPRKLKMISASHLKTDRLDAEILARLARLAQLDPRLVKSVSIRTQETELLRSEMRVREQLVATRTRFIALSRNIVRGQGIRLRPMSPANFASRLTEMDLPAAVRLPLQPLLPLIAELTKSIAEMEARFARVAAEHSATALFREIDGVGLLTSLAFVLCIEDPRRFAHSREVGPYLGLVPIVRQSSKTERRGRITKMGDSGMRRLLVQAAHLLLMSRKDSALKTWALRIKERQGRKKAVIALARKLATVMHHLWVSGSHYERFPGVLGTSLSLTDQAPPTTHSLDIAVLDNVESEQEPNRS